MGGFRRPLGSAPTYMSAPLPHVCLGSGASSSARALTVARAQEVNPQLRGALRHLPSPPKKLMPAKECMLHAHFREHCWRPLPYSSSPFLQDMGGWREEQRGIWECGTKQGPTATGTAEALTAHFLQFGNSALLSPLLLKPDEATRQRNAH
ncbi:hypothetical protein NDU88_005650 [Pleurodeles waltl]|uniref:Uncharacterized protein n=1 Tax=Pleurodeles waltl TaxID=8319 RepID=A0AAV7NMZ7_PLEWA|nr:hypothetical protein NDU88_005650 [Pleurodeles waltl]